MTIKLSFTDGLRGQNGGRSKVNLSDLLVSGKVANCCLRFKSGKGKKRYARCI